jgi:hypothetical protein
MRAASIQARRRQGSFRPEATHHRHECAAHAPPTQRGEPGADQQEADEKRRPGLIFALPRIAMNEM